MLPHFKTFGNISIINNYLHRAFLWLQSNRNLHIYKNHFLVIPGMHVSFAHLLWLPFSSLAFPFFPWQKGRLYKGQWHYLLHHMYITTGIYEIFGNWYICHACNSGLWNILYQLTQISTQTIIFIIRSVQIYLANLPCPWKSLSLQYILILSIPYS